MTDSPTADRPVEPVEPVGVILQRWRKRRRLTGQQLGDRVGMSQAKISRLENGHVSVEPGDVRLLVEALDVPRAEAERLVELAEHADDRLLEWVPAGADQATRQREFGRAEAVAREIRIMQPAVLPGLLQTSEYARAILSANMDDDSAVSEAVNARIQRNQILHSGEREFRFLITEQVLRNQVCRPAEMISQIYRMREVAAFPNVRIGIITDDVDLPIAPYHGFYVADDRWVSVDLFTTTLRSAGRQTLREFRRVFDRLEAVAVTDIDDLLSHYLARYARMLVPNQAAR
ncbi:transcriptional regulator [Actinoplanes sp. OR16]|uniref:helix-turn-helix domain-containing protein n=1 Tax=Actinoplanes sp. OR16 TaxID=946334 RepID=UPI000F6DF3AD|nr:helix-turn-helix transcriptional regulator [Actinoplanes sp. OR16]BBH68232.1 transcriptional regulator [Actinoplanes sp. OR16]